MHVDPVGNKVECIGNNVMERSLAMRQKFSASLQAKKVNESSSDRHLYAFSILQCAVGVK